MNHMEKLVELGYGETPVRVRYAETDQMGIVYHANYLVWFEMGRVEFIRQMGMDYRSMESDEGMFIAVVEATARYMASARYDDELMVRTSLAGMRGPVIRFRYKIVRVKDETLLCEGETVHIVVGRDLKRRAMPEKYAAAFRALMERIQARPAAGGDGQPQ
jgi:acyl-CoA thioester hydrolase